MADIITTNSKEFGNVPNSVSYRESMAYTVAPADIGILHHCGAPEDDIAHCIKVADKALEIAYRTNKAPVYHCFREQLFRQLLQVRQSLSQVI